jgi:hypothetical protein
MDTSSLEGNAVRAISILIMGILVYTPAISFASDRPGQTDQRADVIIVIGAAGTAEYGSVFAQSADLWQKAVSKGNANSVVIGLDETESEQDKTILEQTLKNEPNDTDQALWLVLIGHGTFDGRTAKFNLRGPDVSAQELAEWIQPLHRPLAVIDTTSSSAPFLSKLSAQNRVIITATRSGFELNYARFGQYLADAIADPQADLDKDGQTSLLEAFLTASHKVTEFYSGAGRLATEHALLDDNGDGLGTPADWFRGIRPVQKAKDNASLDGYRAHQFYLIRSEAENNMPPQLRAQRDQLELEVVKLRDAKENFSEDEYFSRLEKLLYKMARIYEQADNIDNSH